MHLKKTITIILGLFLFIYSINIIYQKFFKIKSQNFYTTTNAEKRDLFQIINATGTLEIKNRIKIGSLVSGTVKKIFVTENESVKKGQILALIDNGKNNTDVRKADGALKAAQADLEYQKKYLKRQQELFKANQISKDFFEQVTRDYQKYQADVITKQADLEQKQIEYKNTKILSPANGIIVNIGITEGERITTNLNATVLFIIAKNLTKMEAELYIDESDIGKIKKNQKVTFKVSTYPNRRFHGIITQVSFYAQTKNNILSYIATVDVDNKSYFLRPGLTVNAKITVAKSLNCLTIPIQSFQINSELLKKLAKKIHYNFKPINKNEKLSLEEINNKNHTINYVWVIDNNNNFIEKTVQLGITDNNYFEIKKGITINDKIIIDIQEEDKMKKLYKKWFKGAF